MNARFNLAVKRCLEKRGILIIDICDTLQVKFRRKVWAIQKNETYTRHCFLSADSNIEKQVVGFLIFETDFRYRSFSYYVGNYKL
jgi:hypothetical protein